MSGRHKWSEGIPPDFVSELSKVEERRVEALLTSAFEASSTRRRGKRGGVHHRRTVKEKDRGKLFEAYMPRGDRTAPLFS